MNGKECYEFKIHIRDLDHLYQVVRWMNANVGRGKQHWTIPGRVKRKLATSGGMGVKKTVKVFKPDFDAEQTAFYLNLL